MAEACHARRFAETLEEAGNTLGGFLEGVSLPNLPLRVTL